MCYWLSTELPLYQYHIRFVEDQGGNYATQVSYYSLLFLQPSKWVSKRILVVAFLEVVFIKEEFEDTKEVFRIRKLKDRKLNGQTKKREKREKQRSTKTKDPHSDATEW